MHNFKFPAFVLSILFILLTLHLYGMQNHLYLSYWYYDLITHFIGGAGIALSVLYIVKNPKNIISITIIAGMLWEVFEVYYNITGWPTTSPQYRIDTSIDLIMDTLGAVVVWIWIKYKK